MKCINTDNQCICGREESGDCSCYFQKSTNTSITENQDVQKLISQVVQLQFILKTKNEIIDKYAWHKKDCMLFSIAEHPHCTCGFEQAIASAERSKK